MSESPFFTDFIQWLGSVHPYWSDIDRLGPMDPVMVSSGGVTLPSTLFGEITDGIRTIYAHTRDGKPSTESIFTSFDFHYSDQSLKLIEINTNAAGALLIDALGRYRRLQFYTDRNTLSEIKTMFEAVYSQGHRIAIVDETPEFQKTRFEFVMFQKLLQHWGWSAVIVSPDQMRWTGSELIGPDGNLIDGVYNRYCDFLLTSEVGDALRQAIDHGVPISPNPQEYHRIADKMVLNQLANIDHPIIQQWIPPIIDVQSADRHWLWANRKQLFFKPVGSYGSKAAYKGERLSKKVFESLWHQPMIAQTYFPPSTVTVGDTTYKYDIRVISFKGEVQTIGARLFQGQVMNFQTLGGGFAPIHFVG